MTHRRRSARTSALTPNDGTVSSTPRQRTPSTSLACCQRSSATSCQLRLRPPCTAEAQRARSASASPPRSTHRIQGRGSLPSCSLPTKEYSNKDQATHAALRDEPRRQLPRAASPIPGYRRRVSDYVHSSSRLLPVDMINQMMPRTSSPTTIPTSSLTLYEQEKLTARSIPTEAQMLSRPSTDVRTAEARGLHRTT